MQCHFCQAPSEMRFTEIVKGEKQSMPICRSCAAERGLVAASPSEPAPLTKITLPAWARNATAHCPRCRTTLGGIRRRGRVGCPECYRFFREQLQPLLRRMHGSVEHGGHRHDPAAHSSPPTAGHHEELRALEAQLRQAIENEDFESAARIRDQLAAARSADSHRGDHR